MYIRKHTLHQLWGRKQTYAWQGLDGDGVTPKRQVEPGPTELRLSGDHSHHGPQPPTSELPRKASHASVSLPRYRVAHDKQPTTRTRRTQKPTPALSCFVPQCSG